MRTELSSRLASLPGFNRKPVEKPSTGFLFWTTSSAFSGFSFLVNVYSLIGLK
jgi:hypothetical protein